MEIILSKQCESLTGSFGRGFGYFIVGRWSRKEIKYRYYSQRSRWGVSPDGHLRFIFTCAELAQNNLHITDIRVKRDEVVEALREAGKHVVAAYINAYKEAFPTILRKDDIINLKNTYGL